ncbi:hypothetical protein ACH47B_31795 [Rhodococcus sp. NPDC019627]|uniref:hypothetical protein n=1 Tax=Rhodococcus sp. NPDC019627 TaxID=3364505 RepID=UPI00378BF414
MSPLALEIALSRRWKVRDPSIRETEKRLDRSIDTLAAIAPERQYATDTRRSLDRHG